MEYTLIRSGRRTLALELRGDGTVVVRAPKRVSRAEIERFVQSREDWIQAHRERMAARRESLGAPEKLSPEELRALAERAKTVIPERAAYYAPLVGVSYGRITIRAQRSRWGSCSARGNLNFNCLLLLAPQQVLDSVVVHELCHRREMNHSPRFYAQVLRVFPEYRIWSAWLKEHGAALMARLPET